MKNCTRLHKIYMAIATVILLSHLVVAAIAGPSFGRTMFADAAPCALLLLALLAIRETLRSSPGMLPAFWKVFSGGLIVMFLSQFFWFYFDWARLHSTPSPVPGDSLFIVAHVFFLSALALRPHSSSGGSNLRIRSLDFVLLNIWWLCLYLYFALPWTFLADELGRYNVNYCLLVAVEHSLIVGSLVVLCARRRGPWRFFYFQLLVTFLLVAAGNLLMSSFFTGFYPGGFYDTPFLVALYLFTVIASFGASLQPEEDASPNREVVLSVWMARFAMMVMLSLPVIALWGLQAKGVPQLIAIFRLRLIFVSMFVLGGLVYWKLNLLTSELASLIRLTGNSIENLKSVQQQVSLSEKFVALGRLAAGAAHEISNPLTAILGYSELLTDVSSLSAEDRATAQLIREQVHRAQAAVTSLRNTMRRNSPSSTLVGDKKADS